MSGLIRYLSSGNNFYWERLATFVLNTTVRDLPMQMMFITSVVSKIRGVLKSRPKTSVSWYLHSEDACATIPE